MLLTSTEPLVGVYDLAMLDLDGVVYVGRDAVPGAPARIAAAREAGMRMAFITNNAARPPDVVAQHLSELGVPADQADVVTSAQAAARMIAETHGVGARVLCLGGPGLRAALAAERLVPVDVDDEADVIASGYGPELRWREIMRAAVRIADGLPWVASNTDYSLPTPHGIAPGHGVLVETLTRFTGTTPAVAGKPARPLLDETIRRMGGRRPLMVGDRLDTDIEGAHNAGVDSLLVLTGVTGLAELADLAATRPALRPSYVAPDLGGLLEPHPAPERQPDGSWVLAGWRGHVDRTDGHLAVDRTAQDATVADWWRVAAVTAWHHGDTTGRLVDITRTRVPGDDPAPR